MTITLGSSCDSPGMSAMPGAFIFGEEIGPISPYHLYVLSLFFTSERKLRRVFQLQNTFSVVAIEPS